MKFSIVTCTWNSAKFLNKCIESIHQQSYKDYEHIFVDGGSDDGTLAIIDGVSQEKHLLHDIRGGISNAMNRGIEASTGDVVVHLHSDDYFADNGVLEKVANLFSVHSPGWIFGRCLSDLNGQLVAEKYEVPEYSYRRLLKSNFIPHPATFIRRELFQEFGFFDEKCKYAMDYDLWLRLGKVSIPMQVDDHLAVFRRHPGSLSTANRLAAMNEDFQIRMRYASSTIYSRMYHYSHYLVRKYRAQKSLAKGD